MPEPEIAFLQRWIQVEFVYRWLDLACRYDMQDSFWWRTDGEYAPVTIFVNCNDLFWWATADSEQVTPDNLDVLEQAIKDCRAIDDCSSCGIDLFCCRLRKMRPQGACYKHIKKELWHLFDAAGPERAVDNGPFGNTTKPT